MSRIIAIVNQKGGVGKTTTAMNLAAGLAVMEKKTLLIDLDPQGNSSSGLGINKNDIEKHIYQVIIGKVEIAETILPTSMDNLEIVPANINLTGAEIELVKEFAREQKLKEALKSITGNYEYIIIDCPPSLGLLSVNALTACTDVIIPIQCEYFALEGVSQLLNTIRLIQQNLNPKLNVFGILLTMYDKRLNLANQVVSEVKRYFKEQVFDTMINRNVKLCEAPSYGKSIFEYDIKSVGSQNYLELASEVVNK